MTAYLVIYMPKVYEHFIGGAVVIPLHFLGCCLYVSRDFDVDKPETLTKSATVEWYKINLEKLIIHMQSILFLRLDLSLLKINYLFNSAIKTFFVRAFGTFMFSIVFIIFLEDNISNIHDRIMDSPYCLEK